MQPQGIGRPNSCTALSMGNITNLRSFHLEANHDVTKNCGLIGLSDGNLTGKAALSKSNCLLRLAAFDVLND